MAILAVGCGVDQNRSKGRGSLPTGYKLPPPPPKKQVVAIDPALRRAAETELSKLFASNDPVLRANAVEATQHTVGPANAPRLIAALTDQGAIVRFAGAMAVGALRLDAARPRLLTMTEDPNKSVRIAVRYALHRLGDTRLSHDFEVFAKDPDPRVRSNAALALGLLGEPTALNILKVMQHDESVPVRLQVMEAMWRLGDEDARDKLVTGTISKYPDDAIVCLLALAGPKKPEIVRYVRAQLTNDYEEVKLAAARAAGMLGLDDGMAIPLKDAGSNDVRQRSMSALALGDIGRADAQPTLRKLLNDSDASVRLAAATAILQLKAG